MRSSPTPTLHNRPYGAMPQSSSRTPTISRYSARVAPPRNQTFRGIRGDSVPRFFFCRAVLRYSARGACARPRVGRMHELRCCVRGRLWRKQFRSFFCQLYARDAGQASRSATSAPEGLENHAIESRLPRATTRLEHTPSGSLR